MPVPLVRRALAALAALAAFGVAARPASALTVDDQSMIARTNAVRAFWHEAPLQENATLQAKAEAWALALSQAGVLMHSYLPAGVQSLDWWKLGENVGVTSAPDASADQVVFDTFVASRHHFANLIDPGFNAVGIGMARSADGRLWVAEEFARVG
jgi:uncharacterized protein YkwD